jgi:hypothetical protein
MPEIGTSGSMSGDGKRSVAEWPKLPRPSSTLPKRTYRDDLLFVCFWGEADMHRGVAWNDPERSYALVHYGSK